MSVGALISPFIAKKYILYRLGRIHTAQIGFTIAACGLFLFGVASLVRVDSLFLALSKLARFLEGGGVSVANCAVNIMAVSYFK